MSLINQMLRDLDARHAPAVDRTALPPAVHLPQQVRRGKPWPTLALALILVAAGAGYWQTQQAEPLPPPLSAPQRSAPSPAPVAPTIAPPQAPPVAVSPPTVPGVAPPAATPPAVAQPAAAEKMPPIPPGAPVLNKAAAPVPNKTVAGAVGTPAKPTVTAIGPLRPEPKPSAAPQKAAAAPPPAVAAPAPKEMLAPLGPTSIDKRSHTSPAAEAAENEYRKAMAALRRGATSEAVDGLHAALRTDKLHVSARQALLSLAVEQQQWAEAQALSEEGLAIDPAQTGWAMILARLQLEGGKLAEAADTLARHAAYAEQNADYQAFRALLLQKLKRSGEAALRYRAALVQKPTESRWWYGLGLSLEADQKPQEAREAFLKARETGNLPPELASAVDQRLR